MGETIVQIVVDFIAEYGILAAIVFGLIWDSGKRGKQQAAIMQGMINNQAQETKQQDRLITQNGLTISKVSRLEDLFARWIETHTQENVKKNAIIETGIATIDKLDESVNDMSTDIDRIIAELAAVRKDMNELTVTVKQATTEITRTVAIKTTEVERRLQEVEASVMDLQPAVPTILEPIPKPKTPKPKDKFDKRNNS